MGEKNRPEAGFVKQSVFIECLSNRRLVFEKQIYEEVIMISKPLYNFARVTIYVSYAVLIAALVIALLA